MGLHDRDWYQEEMRKKAGGTHAESSAHRQSKTPPQRDEGPTKVYMGLGTPPEPHEWPWWLVAFVWLLVFAAAFVVASLVLERRASRAVPASAPSALPSCSSVPSGPCVKSPGLVV